MALMKTSNPALAADAFRGYGMAIGDTMTLSGTVNKTGFLMVLAVLTAAWSWNLESKSPETAMVLAAIGAIGGLIVAMVTIFKQAWSPVTAPIYALLEGLVLGSVSMLFEIRYPGIALQAVGLTFGTLLVLLLAYRSGVIRVTEKFRMGVVAATGGIALFYLVTSILGLFGIHFNSVYGSGPIGIGFSVFVVIVASLNLVLDFDVIERGVRSGAPKYMEWYGGFAMLITLIWLYFEILRLLVKLRSRD
jgi:uncharacterized YccA/Bax inhibitor family protein